ncbi:MAG: hypothetical protein H6522_12765 [Mycolicibacterium sp.]|nr:hypothetical protein [Mycolicibacterium sp.]
MTDDERLHVRRVRQGSTDEGDIGIRRRLAPLLENDRNQIELFTAMLLSLPGSPVLYCNDEIGMGDIIWLSDRDGVRTPMQWTLTAMRVLHRQPGQAVPAAQPGSHLRYGSVNVEGSARQLDIAANWTRTMLAVRRRHEAFAVGNFRELGGPTVGARLCPRSPTTPSCCASTIRPVSPADRTQPAALELLHPGQS